LGLLIGIPRGPEPQGHKPHQHWDDKYGATADGLAKFRDYADFPGAQNANTPGNETEDGYQRTQKSQTALKLSSQYLAQAGKE
jgi:hypothetical protein